MSVLELTFPGGHRTRTTVQGFTIETDYPEYLGGEGSAPAPWHIFLSALTSCAGIHIRNYCAGHNLPYTEIRITLDPVVSANDPDWFTDFNLDIFLPEGFPAEHIEPMLAEAGNCRVAKHLCVHPVRVNLKTVTVQQ